MLPISMFAEIAWCLAHGEYDQCTGAAEQYGKPGNLVIGANVAGFLKVAKAMMAQGLV